MIVRTLPEAAWRFPLLVTTLWLVATVASVAAAQVFHGQAINFDRFATSWDGGWYRSIVEAGYNRGQITSQANVAFFPLYPALVKIVAIAVPVTWAGTVVPVACFAAASTLLYRLVTEKYGTAIAKWTAVITACNPWSFYFAMMYSEALFLLLAVGVFYYLHRRRFWLTALLAGLASGTRPPGVVLGLIVVVSWIVLHHHDFRALPAYVKLAGLALLSSGGLLLFMTFLQVNNNDALAFVHVQQYWPGRGGAGLFGELAALVRHLTSHNFTLQYAIVAMWYSVVVIGVIGAALLAKGRRYAEASFVFLVLFMGLAAGSATSMNRYLVVLFPLSILLAQLIHRQGVWLKTAVVSLLSASAAVMIDVITRPDHPFIG